MNSDRVKVLHRADCYNVALRVTHYLKLYFLPACNALLNQHLSDRRKIQTVSCYLTKLLFVVDYSAACSSESECRSDYQRIAYPRLVCKFYSLLYRVYNKRGYAWLTDRLHSVLEELSVLSLVNCFGISSQKLHSVLIKEALLCKLHGECQSCLTAEGREKTVGALLLYNSSDSFKGKGLDIDFICHCAVCHDSCRV